MSNILRSALPFLDIVFLGHLSTDALGAASLANVWVSMSTQWLFSGQEEVISTLTAQAVGAGSRRLAGAWLQIALIVMFALLLPISVTWVFAGRILSGLGFSPESLTTQAELFTRWLLLALPAMGVTSALSAWLNALGSTMPVIVTSAAMVAVSVPANILLIWGVGSKWDGLGFIGSPISTAIVTVVGMLVVILLIWRLGLSRGTLHRIHWHIICSRSNWRVFLEQAAPNFAGMLLELLQLQVLAGVAAKLGEVDLSTHNALINVFGIATAALFGAVRGTSVRVGVALGSRRLELLKQTVYVALAVLVGGSIIVGVGVTAAKAYVPRMFTSDPEVLALAEPLMPLLGLSLIGFSFEFTAVGVLLGAARPLAVVVAVLIGNWVVCIPLAIVLTHVVGMGLQGIWIALTAGYGVVTIITVWLVLKSDWPALAEEAAKRSAEEQTATSRSVERAGPDSDDDGPRDSFKLSGRSPGGMSGADASGKGLAAVAALTLSSIDVEAAASGATGAMPVQPPGPLRQTSGLGRSATN